MIPVRAELDLHADEPVDIGDVTDMIEAMIDHLDDLGLAPSISTSGLDPVHMVIELEVESEARQAMDTAAMAVRSAFGAVDSHEIVIRRQELAIVS